jgi:NAD(P)-dependent dehydrogenase (short-subunit alcohol dehydrogenase family)
VTPDVNELTDLTGRVALVTGAASGIGRAAAVALARAGAAVVTADLDLDGAQSTAASITGEGGAAVACHCDVTSEDDVDTAVALAVEQFGGLHLAHNNAGIGAPPAFTVDVADADFDRVLAVDLTGVFLCMKAEIAWMLEHGGGVIVNTSSGAGLIGYPTAGPYFAAKHGVIGLTKTAALEFVRRGIRVNAVCPGTIETPFVGDLVGGDARARAALLRTQPGGAFGTPEDIANAVVWLCSDAARFVTGTALTVDGGAVEAQGVLLDH